MQEKIETPAFLAPPQKEPPQIIAPTIQPIIHQAPLQTSEEVCRFDESGEDEDEYEDECDVVDVKTRGRSLGLGSKYTARGVRFKMANLDRQH